MKVEAENGDRSTDQLAAIENARRELDARRREEERARLRRQQHSQVNGSSVSSAINGSSQASGSGGASASTQ